MTPEEVFDKWFQTYHADSITDGDVYPIAKQAFLESRRQALQEAANLCESNHIISGSIGPLFNAGWEEAIKGCAEAIKSLMEKS